MEPPPPVDPPVNPSPRFEPHKRAAQFVSPQAPPDQHHDRFIYGLMQPILGARMLLSDGALLRGALLPAALLGGFCLLVAVLDVDGWSLREIGREWLKTFAVLAPLPSVVLAHYYARLAARAHHKFGFSPVEPCIEPFGYAVRRLVKQTILIAIALVPLYIVFSFVPFAGKWLKGLAAALWALHWIVVDAFDSARTLQPGQTLADLDALAAQAPRPWFTRALDAAGRRVPFFAPLLGWFAHRLDRLALPWREESALVEEHPSLMAGFALSTALFVATPVLNLLFRPIVIIAAVHVLGRLEHEPRQLPPPSSNPPSSVPPPPVPPSSVPPPSSPV
jgi:hypothetical protein